MGDTAENPGEDVLRDFRLDRVVDDQPKDDPVEDRLPILASEPLAGLICLFQALADRCELLSGQLVVLSNRVVDGDIRLTFTPLSSCYREGSTPGAVVDVMREVGFDVSEDDAEADHPAEAALALAERLTGVHLTPEFLEQADYTCGVAPAPEP